MVERIYVDTEFLGHGGPLLSLAIADPGGVHWYGVLPWPDSIDPWVKENVIPKLFLMPPTFAPGELITPERFRESLLEYLRWRQGATIVADWPGDIRHLLALFEGPTYAKSWCPRFKLQLVITPDGQPQPAIPHNALSDAIALMEWDQRLAGGP